jgi:hypothetical protein
VLFNHYLLDKLATSRLHDLYESRRAQYRAVGKSAGDFLPREAGVRNPLGWRGR